MPQIGKSIIHSIDLDKNQTQKRMQLDEIVVFWKWLPSGKLAIIGKTGVYHVSLDGKSNDRPELMFERDQGMREFSIVNYQSDHEEKWVALNGFHVPSNSGRCQLINLETKKSIVMEAYASCFSRMPISDSKDLANLVCFCHGSTKKQSLIVLDSRQPDFTTTPQVRVEIDFEQEGDHAVLMQAAPRYGIIFILTKKG